jgi:hypothetical protein
LESGLWSIQGNNTSRENRIKKMLRIYCDETWTSQSELNKVKTPYFVFYGVMVDDGLESNVLDEIHKFKDNRGLLPPQKEFPTEIKWQKVEEEWKEARKNNRSNRYEEFLDIFFGNLKQKKLSFGYMFIDKREYYKVEQEFLRVQNDNQHNFFFMLYFQFLYHCFIKPQVKQQPCEIFIDMHDVGAEGRQYDIGNLKEILNRKIYRELTPKGQLLLSDEMRKKISNSVQLVDLADSREFPLIQMSDLCAGCIRYALENQLHPPLKPLPLFGETKKPEPKSGKENLTYYFYQKLREIDGYADINLLKISYHHRFNIFPFTFNK